MRIPRVDYSSLPQNATRLIIAVAVFMLAVWLAFFDSHSLYQRFTWQRELARLEVENREMVRKIEEIEVKLDQAKADEVIEQIAREQYGMRRPGETVYRVRNAE